jgi:hypothetical protein
MTDLTPLLNLIAQWDALADANWRKGDDQQERYFYGVMFGLETCHDELARVVADMMRAAVKADSIT